MAVTFTATTDQALTDGNDMAELRNISPLTVSAWIYPTGWGQNNYGRICSKENTNEGWSFFVSNNGGISGVQTLAFFRERATTDTNVRGADNAVTLNTWQHVAVAYNTTSTTLYVNGVALSTVYYVAGSGAENDDSNDWIMIGNRDWTCDRGFAGRIEDVRIWNRKLSADEIVALYACKGHDSIFYSQVGRWPLREKAPGVAMVSGNYEVKDETSYGNHMDIYSEAISYSEGVIVKKRRVT